MIGIEKPFLSILANQNGRSRSDKRIDHEMSMKRTILFNARALHEETIKELDSLLERGNILGRGHLLPTKVVWLPGILDQHLATVNGLHDTSHHCHERSEAETMVSRSLEAR